MESTDAARPGDHASTDRQWTARLIEALRARESRSVEFKRLGSLTNPGSKAQIARIIVAVSSTFDRPGSVCTLYCHVQEVVGDDEQVLAEAVKAERECQMRSKSSASRSDSGETTASGTDEEILNRRARRRVVSKEKIDRELAYVLTGGWHLPHFKHEDYTLLLDQFVGGYPAASPPGASHHAFQFDTDDDDFGDLNGLGVVAIEIPFRAKLGEFYWRTRDKKATPKEEHFRKTSHGAPEARRRDWIREMIMHPRDVHEHFGALSHAMSASRRSTGDSGGTHLHIGWFSGNRGVLSILLMALLPSLLAIVVFLHGRSQTEPARGPEGPLGAELRLVINSYVDPDLIDGVLVLPDDSTSQLRRLLDALRPVIRVRDDPSRRGWPLERSTFEMPEEPANLAFTVTHRRAGQALEIRVRSMLRAPDGPIPEGEPIEVSLPSVWCEDDAFGSIGAFELRLVDELVDGLDDRLCAWTLAADRSSAPCTYALQRTNGG